VSWLRQPIVLTRRAVLVLALSVGLLSGAGIIIGALAVDRVAEEERRAIEADTLTASDVEDIARRILLLEEPPDDLLTERVLNAIKLCAERPRCRMELRRAVLETPPT
jgi:hypothetical protein